MLQIIVATHGDLGRELVHIAQLIIGAQSDLAAVCVEIHEGIEDLRHKLETLLQHRPQEGALVLVDMFGGSPSNVALVLSQKYPLKVVTGVNLPMLLEAITHRSVLELGALAELVRSKGQQSIINADELLNPPFGRER
jgi:PTS system mannose-specific IIA component